MAGKEYYAGAPYAGGSFDEFLGEIAPSGSLSRTVIPGDNNEGSITPTGAFSALEITEKTTVTGSITPSGTLEPVADKHIVRTLIPHTADTEEDLSDEDNIITYMDGLIKYVDVDQVSDSSEIEPTSDLALIKIQFLSISGSITPAGSATNDALIRYEWSIDGGVTPTSTLVAEIIDTTTLEWTILRSAQNVIPRIYATWADSRILDNITVASSSQVYTTYSEELSPLLWWQLNDSDSSIEDYSSNNKDGTVSGSVTYGIDGPLKGPDDDVKAIELPGSPSYIYIDDSDLNFTTDFAIEVWALQTATPGSDTYVLAKGTNVGASNIQYGFMAIAGGEWRAFVSDGSTITNITQSGAATVDEWYHLVLAVEGNRFTFHVDGELIDSETVSAVNTTAGDFAIGRPGSLGSNYFVGSVAQLAVYDSMDNFTPGKAWPRYLSGINDGTYTLDNFFNPKQAVNAREQLSYPWAVTDIKDEDDDPIYANGEYYTMEDEDSKKHEYGWWARTVSTSGGDYPDKGTVVLEFDERPATHIQVFTSEFHAPLKTYDLWYKNTSGIWEFIGTETMTTGMYDRSTPIDGGPGGAVDIQGVRVDILSIDGSSDFARIQEIVPLYKEDISERVVNVETNANRESFDSNVPIGITAANSLSVELDNTDNYLSAKSTTSDVADYILPDVRLEIELGWEVDPSIDEYEYVHYGTFWVDEWNENSSSMTVTASARDFSKFMQETDVDGVLYQKLRGSTAVTNLARYAGVPAIDLDYIEAYKATIVKDKPVAYWPMDETDETRYALSFDGTVLDVASGQFYSFPADQLTVEFWVNTDNRVKDSTAISFATTAHHNEFTIYKMRNMDIIIDQNYQTHGTGVDVADGEWHHVAVTWNNDDGVVQIYVDGINEYEQPLTGSIGQTLSVGGSLVLGQDQDTLGGGFSADQSMDGYITDVRIWNDVRTEDEIRENAERILLPFEQGLVAYYPMIEGEQDIDDNFTLINKSSPTGDLAASNVDIELVPIQGLRDYAHTYSGHWYGDPDFGEDETPIVSEKGNTSMLLDGTDDYAEVTYRTEFANLSNQFSIEAWFNKSSDTDMTILSQGPDNGSIKLMVSSENRVRLQNVGYELWRTIEGSIASDQWHHVVATLDENQIVKIYLDGLLAHTSNSSINFVDNESPIFIGTADATMSSEMFEGYLSDVAVYDHALSAAEIEQHYIAGRSLVDWEFSALWAQETTIWDGMLEISTADMGIYFFNKDDKFVYDNTINYKNPYIHQYADVQREIEDENHIVNGSHIISLLVNRVKINIHKVNDVNSEREGLWAAEDNESLVSGTLKTSIDKYRTADLSYNRKKIEDVWVPLWTDEGFVKIDNEIIKYARKSDAKLFELERGQFDTDAASHTAGARVREVREYNIEYGEKPAIVQYDPLITAVDPDTLYLPAEVDNYQSDKTVDLELWEPNAFNAHLIISRNTEGDAYSTQILQGNDPLTGLENVFVISGIPLVVQNSSEKVDEITEEYEENLRKFREKEIEIDNQFIQTQAYAKQLAQFIISFFKNPVPIIEVETIGIPMVELGDRIKIRSFDQLAISNRDYWVESVDTSYDGGVSQKMTLREVVE